MLIDNVTIKRGENKIIRIPVGSLPSGVAMEMEVHVFRSLKDGPTMLVTGGLHGNEINGVEIVRRALKADWFDHLKCGTVIAIPLVNVHGFINFSRDLPDGKDVNRSFPGHSRGSLAGRIGAILSKHIIPNSDFGIDYHTGGKRLHNHPQVRYNADDKASRELAAIFEAPFQINSGLINRSFRKECFKSNVPMLVFEGGESLRMDSQSIQEGLDGMLRILVHHNMLAENVTSRTSVMIASGKWIRATKSGVFLPFRKSGDHVKVGEVIGFVNCPYGGKETKVVCKKEGYIYGHNNMPVVNLGDPLFHIGYSK